MSATRGRFSMTSILQIKANRRNAQLSTGPKTAAGRHISSMNALKHGLTAQHAIVFDEAIEDFQAFHGELLSELRPRGGFELALAERVILCAWRLRRVYRIETGLFCRTRKSGANGEATTTNDIDVVFLRLASHDDELAKLTRYETSLERSLQRAFRALERQQRERGALAVGAPMLLPPLPGS
jgi:hypothetical protein